MTKKGKLIVFEGTDGSGKSTQFRILTERLEREKLAFRHIVFPQYKEESSALIRMYLGGAFGNDPKDVNAYAASTFYAVDRYASYRRVWKEYYEAGGLVLSDRYTTSNAVHQGAKVPAGPERQEYLRWLYDFEYERLGLPKPDLVLYLQVPTELTEAMMRRRERDTHTKADIHEQDMDYLRTCGQMGQEAAAYYGWQVIHCARDGAMRSIEDIHEEIYGKILACLED